MQNPYFHKYLKMPRVAASLLAPGS